MGNTNSNNTPNQDKLNTSLAAFLTLAQPPAKLKDAIQALVVNADCSQLDKDHRQTILLWQEFLEENNL